MNILGRLVRPLNKSVGIALMCLTMSFPAQIGFAGERNSEASAASLLPTTETIRQSMVRIRNLVVDHHTLVTHRRMPSKMAIKFAEAIKAEAIKIRREKIGDTKAQQAIENILKSLIAGVDAVAKKNTKMSPIDGIVSMDEALALYAKTFDHPGWKSPQEP